MVYAYILLSMETILLFIIRYIFKDLALAICGFYLYIENFEVHFYNQHYMGHLNLKIFNEHFLN